MLLLQFFLLYSNSDVSYHIEIYNMLLLYTVYMDFLLPYLLTSFFVKVNLILLYRIYPYKIIITDNAIHIKPDVKRIKKTTISIQHILKRDMIDILFLIIFLVSICSLLLLHIIVQHAFTIHRLHGFLNCILTTML